MKTAPGIGLAIAAVVIIIACADTGAERSVATLVVTRDVLQRSVHAEGVLQARHSTVVRAPPMPEGFAPLRLSWVAVDGTRVRKGDVILRFDATALSLRLTESKTRLAVSNTERDIERVSAKAAQESRKVDRRIAALELEKTRQFERKDPEIYSEHQRIEARVDTELTAARLEHARTVERLERKNRRSKRSLAEAGRQRISANVTDTTTALGALEVRAPHDGLLVLARDRRREPRRAGDRVWPGQKLAEIPRLDEMQAEVFVLEVDGQGLKVGLPAKVVLESRPDQTLTGTVARVDSVAKPRLRHVPTQYIAAVIALESTHGIFLKPGQRVRAQLPLSRHDGVVVPRHAVFMRDGVAVVFVRSTFVGAATEWAQRPVTLGAASIGRVVIEEGLAPGETIALSDPRPGAP